MRQLKGYAERAEVETEEQPTVTVATSVSSNLLKRRRRSLRRRHHARGKGKRVTAKRVRGKQKKKKKKKASVKTPGDGSESVAKKGTDSAQEDAPLKTPPPTQKKPVTKIHRPRVYTPTAQREPHSTTPSSPRKKEVQVIAMRTGDALEGRLKVRKSVFDLIHLRSVRSPTTTGRLVVSASRQNRYHPYAEAVNIAYISDAIAQMEKSAVKQANQTYTLPPLLKLKGKSQWHRKAGRDSPWKETTTKPDGKSEDAPVVTPLKHEHRDRRKRVKFAVKKDVEVSSEEEKCLRGLDLDKKLRRKPKGGSWTAMITQTTCAMQTTRAMKTTCEMQSTRAVETRRRLRVVVDVAPPLRPEVTQGQASSPPAMEFYRLTLPDRLRRLLNPTSSGRARSLEETGKSPAAADNPFTPEHVTTNLSVRMRAKSEVGRKCKSIHERRPRTLGGRKSPYMQSHVLQKHRITLGKLHHMLDDSPDEGLRPSEMKETMEGNGGGIYPLMKHLSSATGEFFKQRLRRSTQLEQVVAPLYTVQDVAKKQVVGAAGTATLNSPVASKVRTRPGVASVSSANTWTQSSMASVTALRRKTTIDGGSVQDSDMQIRLLTDAPPPAVEALPVVECEVRCDKARRRTSEWRSRDGSVVLDEELQARLSREAMINLDDDDATKEATPRLSKSEEPQDLEQGEEEPSTAKPATGKKLKWSKKSSPSQKSSHGSPASERRGDIFVRTEDEFKSMFRALLKQVQQAQGAAEVPSREHTPAARQETSRADHTADPTERSRAGKVSAVPSVEKQDKGVVRILKFPEKQKKSEQAHEDKATTSQSAASVEIVRMKAKPQYFKVPGPGSKVIRISDPPTPPLHTTVTHVGSARVTVKPLMARDSWAASFNKLGVSSEPREERKMSLLQRAKNKLNDRKLRQNSKDASADGSHQSLKNIVEPRKQEKPSPKTKKTKNASKQSIAKSKKGLIAASPFRILDHSPLRQAKSSHSVQIAEHSSTSVTSKSSRVQLAVATAVDTTQAAETAREGTRSESDDGAGGGGTGGGTSQPAPAVPQPLVAQDQGVIQWIVGSELFQQFVRMLGAHTVSKASAQKSLPEETETSADETENAKRDETKIQVRIEGLLSPANQRRFVSPTPPANATWKDPDNGSLDKRKKFTEVGVEERERSLRQAAPPTSSTPPQDNVESFRQKKTTHNKAAEGYVSNKSKAQSKNPPKGGTLTKRDNIESEEIGVAHKSPPKVRSPPKRTSLLTAAQRQKKGVDQADSEERAMLCIDLCKTPPKAGSPSQSPPQTKNCTLERFQPHRRKLTLDQINSEQIIIHQTTPKVKSPFYNPPQVKNRTLEYSKPHRKQKIIEESDSEERVLCHRSPPKVKSPSLSPPQVKNRTLENSKPHRKQKIVEESDSQESVICNRSPPKDKSPSLSPPHVKNMTLENAKPHRKQKIIEESDSQESVLYNRSLPKVKSPSYSPLQVKNRTLEDSKPHRKQKIVEESDSQESVLCNRSPPKDKLSPPHVKNRTLEDSKPHRKQKIIEESDSQESVLCNRSPPKDKLSPLHVKNRTLEDSKPHRKQKIIEESDSQESVLCNRSPPKVKSPSQTPAQVKNRTLEISNPHRKQKIIDRVDSGESVFLHGTPTKARSPSPSPPHVKQRTLDRSPLYSPPHGMQKTPEDSKPHQKQKTIDRVDSMESHRTPTKARSPSPSPPHTQHRTLEDLKQHREKIITHKIDSPKDQSPYLNPNHPEEYGASTKVTLCQSPLRIRTQKDFKPRQQNTAKGEVDSDEDVFEHGTPPKAGPRPLSSSHLALASFKEKTAEEINSGLPPEWKTPPRTPPDEAFLDSSEIGSIGGKTESRSPRRVADEGLDSQELLKEVEDSTEGGTLTSDSTLDQMEHANIAMQKLADKLALLPSPLLTSNEESDGADSSRQSKKERSVRRRKRTKKTQKMKSSGRCVGRGSKLHRDSSKTSNEGAYSLDSDCASTSMSPVSSPTPTPNDVRYNFDSSRLEEDSFAKLARRSRQALRQEEASAASSHIHLPKRPTFEQEWKLRDGQATPRPATARPSTAAAPEDRPRQEHSRSVSPDVPRRDSNLKLSPQPASPPTAASREATPALQAANRDKTAASAIFPRAEPAPRKAFRKATTTPASPLKAFSNEADVPAKRAKYRTGQTTTDEEPRFRFSSTHVVHQIEDEIEWSSPKLGLDSDVTSAGSATEQLLLNTVSALRCSSCFETGEENKMQGREQLSQQEVMETPICSVSESGTSLDLRTPPLPCLPPPVPNEEPEEGQNSDVWSRRATPIPSPSLIEAATTSKARLKASSFLSLRPVTESMDEIVLSDQRSLDKVGSFASRSAFKAPSTLSLRPQVVSEEDDDELDGSGRSLRNAYKVVRSPSLSKTGSTIRSPVTASSALSLRSQVVSEEDEDFEDDGRSQQKTSEAVGSTGFGSGTVRSPLHAPFAHSLTVLEKNKKVKNKNSDRKKDKGARSPGLSRSGSAATRSPLKAASTLALRSQTVLEENEKVTDQQKLSSKDKAARSPGSDLATASSPIIPQSTLSFRPQFVFSAEQQQVRVQTSHKKHKTVRSPDRSRSGSATVRSPVRKLSSTTVSVKMVSEEKDKAVRRPDQSRSPGRKQSLTTVSPKMVSVEKDKAVRSHDQSRSPVRKQSLTTVSPKMVSEEKDKAVRSPDQSRSPVRKQSLTTVSPKMVLEEKDKAVRSHDQSRSPGRKQSLATVSPKMVTEEKDKTVRSPHQSRSGSVTTQSPVRKRSSTTVSPKIVSEEKRTPKDDTPSPALSKIEPQLETPSALSFPSQLVLGEENLKDSDRLPPMKEEAVASCDSSPPSSTVASSQELTEEEGLPRSVQSTSQQSEAVPSEGETRSPTAELLLRTLSVLAASPEFARDAEETRPKDQAPVKVDSTEAARSAESSPTTAEPEDEEGSPRDGARRRDEMVDGPDPSGPRAVAAAAHQARDQRPHKGHEAEPKELTPTKVKVPPPTPLPVTRPDENEGQVRLNHTQGDKAVGGLTRHRVDSRHFRKLAAPSTSMDEGKGASRKGGEATMVVHTSVRSKGTPPGWRVKNVSADPLPHQKQIGHPVASTSKKSWRNETRDTEEESSTDDSDVWSSFIGRGTKALFVNMKQRLSDAYNTACNLDRYLMPTREARAVTPKHKKRSAKSEEATPSISGQERKAFEVPDQSVFKVLADGGGGKAVRNEDNIDTFMKLLGILSDMIEHGTEEQVQEAIAAVSVELLPDQTPAPARTLSAQPETAKLLAVIRSMSRELQARLKAEMVDKHRHKHKDAPPTALLEAVRVLGNELREEVCRKVEPRLAPSFDSRVLDVAEVKKKDSVESPPERVRPSPPQGPSVVSVKVAKPTKVQKVRVARAADTCSRPPPPTADAHNLPLSQMMEMIVGETSQSRSRSNLEHATSSRSVYYDAMESLEMRAKYKIAAERWAESLKAAGRPSGPGQLHLPDDPSPVLRAIWTLDGLADRSRSHRRRALFTPGEFRASFAELDGVLNGLQQVLPQSIPRTRGHLPELVEVLDRLANDVGAQIVEQSRGWITKDDLNTGRGSLKAGERPGVFFSNRRVDPAMVDTFNSLKVYTIRARNLSQRS